MGAQKKEATRNLEKGTEIKSRVTKGEQRTRERKKENERQREKETLRENMLEEGALGEREE